MIDDATVDGREAHAKRRQVMEGSPSLVLGGVRIDNVLMISEGLGKGEKEVEGRLFGEITVSERA